MPITHADNKHYTDNLRQLACANNYVEYIMPFISFIGVMAMRNNFVLKLT
ncbi:hypothetical protein yberc0001_17520 [Yersinia bercovieri ATCC 43970]|uniref:Uncharacterized protein n=1 Tax=Yersinia bercovieri ATCC 43970 TaxID=349968 RepID=A0ABM9XZC1_YERBE|nr:hypothetical protein yberc0001_17520 [Yersinia bercovieri ATCC 43970]